MPAMFRKYSKKNLPSVETNAIKWTPNCWNLLVTLDNCFYDRIWTKASILSLIMAFITANHWFKKNLTPNHPNLTLSSAKSHSWAVGIYHMYDYAIPPPSVYLSLSLCLHNSSYTLGEILIKLSTKKDHNVEMCILQGECSLTFLKELGPLCQ